MAITIRAEPLFRHAPTPEVVDVIAGAGFSMTLAGQAGGVPAGPGPKLVAQALRKGTPVDVAIAVARTTADPEVLAQLLRDRRKSVVAAATDRCSGVGSWDVLWQHSPSQFGAQAASLSSDPELLAEIVAAGDEEHLSRVLGNVLAPRELRRRAAAVLAPVRADYIRLVVAYRGVPTPDEVFEHLDDPEDGPSPDLLDMFLLPCPAEELVEFIAAHGTGKVPLARMINEGFDNGEDVSHLIAVSPPEVLVEVARDVFAAESDHRLGVPRRWFMLEAFLLVIAGLPDDTDFQSLIPTVPAGTDLRRRRQPAHALLVLAAHPSPHLRQWGQGFDVEGIDTSSSEETVAAARYVSSGPWPWPDADLVLRGLPEGHPAYHDAVLWEAATSKIRNSVRGSELLEMCPIELSDTGLCNALLSTTPDKQAQWFASDPAQLNGFRPEVAAAVVASAGRIGADWFTDEALARIGDYLAPNYTRWLQWPSFSDWFARQLSAGLGDDPTRWEIALSLLGDWNGTLTELIDTTNSLTN